VPSLLQIFQPAVGGVPTYVSAVGRGLAERGWNVTVAGPADAVGMLELREAGVRIAPIAVQRGPQPVQDRLLVQQLSALAREERVDIVHGHSSKASALAALVGRRTRVPSVYTPHAWSFQMRHPLLVRAALAGTEAALTRMHRAVIAVCDAEAAEARRWGVVREQRLFVVHTGLAAEPPEPDRRSARARLGITDDAPLVAWIGRRGAQKRPEDLAELAAGLPADTVVAALGHGLADDAELVSALRAADVRILDGDAAAAADLLAAADVYVLTSAWEGFPLAVLEAMRAALPVVAYEVGGVGEQVQDGLTGHLVDVGDTRALIRAVGDLVRDRQLRERLGRQGREVFEQRFTLERMLDGILDTYAGVLARVPA
jgi:glycosyltransferase involved in cell wall biosynthesis